MSLIKKAQENDTKAVESIIFRFNPKIQKSLLQTDFQNRNDLKQEVSIKMIEAIYKYDINSIPGFWEYVNKK